MGMTESYSHTSHIILLLADFKYCVRRYHYSFLLFPGDVEMDIEYLYKAVPQLTKVFRIMDKIGEGTRSI